MGCIYNGVCSSLVALFLWQQVTNLAAVVAHCGISPNGYGSLSKLDLFSNSLWICLIWGKYVALIRSYIGQEVRKCSLVSTFLTALFWVLIISCYRPNSALHALFGVLCCTQRIFLQNSACRFSISCLSHFVNFWLVSGPQTSHP